MRRHNIHKIYPSGSNTPIANPTIKAHKPSNDMTSHVRAPQKNLASHLNEMLKPYIKPNFVQKIHYEIMSP